MTTQAFFTGQEPDRKAKPEKKERTSIIHRTTNKNYRRWGKIVNMQMQMQCSCMAGKHIPQLKCTQIQNVLKMQNNSVLFISYNKFMVVQTGN